MTTIVSEVDRETVERNMAASRRLYGEVFGRANLEVADEIQAERIVSHGADAPPTTGSQQIKRQAALLR